MGQYIGKEWKGGEGLRKRKQTSKLQVQKILPLSTA